MLVPSQNISRIDTLYEMLVPSQNISVKLTDSKKKGFPPNPL